MITLFVSVSALLGGFALCYFAFGMGVGWSVTTGVVLFLAVQGVMSYLIMKRLKAGLGVMEGIMAQGKRNASALMAKWQFRPPSSMKEAQDKLAAEMKKSVYLALDAIKPQEKLIPWSFFVARQLNTVRLHLYWSIKDFKKVDEVMPKAWTFDETGVSMKMARMYMKDASTEEIGKVYRKSAMRAKYNGNVIAAACWSWILLKRGDEEGAFKALGEALKKSDNATLKRNHECLMNKKKFDFSNSALGERWYMLYLEEPRAPRRQSGAQRVYR